MNNSHQKAVEIENIVRKVFDFNDKKPISMADADVIEKCPIIAPIAVFAPLYMQNKNYEDIDDFIAKYVKKFLFSSNTVENSDMKNFIDELNALVKKYYDK